MLGSIRRIIYSRVGVIVTLAILAVIAIAFAAGDISGVRPAGGPTGGAVAEVGDARVTDTELGERARLEVEQLRAQQPDIDIAKFVAAGGLESVLERMLNGMALEQFAAKIGLNVSQKVVDGEIASIPAFQNFSGQFDQATFERRLAERRITPDQLRADIRREMVAQWLIAPTIGATQMPQQIALPYASLLLERRAGQAAFVPAELMSQGPAPTDAELASYYRANAARYTVPERRVIRYAVVNAAELGEAARPTEAEVAAAYRSQQSRFAPSEQRTLQQVIVADQAVANRVAAQVRGGTALDAAARGVGLEASNQADVTRTVFSDRSSAAVADAAFAGADGAVIGPVRSPLGWHVIRVAGINRIAGRTLEQARPELTAELAKTKAQEALSKRQEQIDTGIADGATFDEVVAEARLTRRTTAPVLASGIDPENPATPAAPALARIVQAGFAAEQGDDAQIVPVGDDGSFAVVATEQVIAAAPRPIAAVRADVTRAFIQDRSLRAARKLADSIVAKVNAGTPLPQAVAGAGVSLPAARPMQATRAELASVPAEQAPPALMMLFTMSKGKARIVPAPNREGWLIVALERVVPASAAGNMRAIQASRASLGQVVDREYVGQFVEAVRRQVGVSRNADAIGRVRADLNGTGAAN